jgi:hypothetical protein
MNGLYSATYQSFCNTKQLLEAETKLLYIIRLKSSPFKLDNILLLPVPVAARSKA